MLVILSDLHLTDGSTAGNVPEGAFDKIFGEIAGERRRKKAQELKIVLLGDIFDLVRTSWWHEQAIPADQRPWGGELDPQTGMNANGTLIEAQFRAVLDRILAHRDTQAFVRKLADLKDAEIVYVLGNHDRVFNNFEALKEPLRERIPRLSFVNCYRDEAYGVLARHGHEWDENCHGWEFARRVLRKRVPGFKKIGRFDPDVARVMTIGEVVTAELLSGFIFNVKRHGSGDDEAFGKLMSELQSVNNLRPMFDVFPWLYWIAGTDEIRKYRKVMHQALSDALDGVLNCALAKEWDHLRTDLLLSGDLTDRLVLARRFLLGDSFNDLRANVGTLNRLVGLIEGRGADGQRYLEGARQEGDWSGSGDGRVQYVVYGHTHQARQVVLSASTDGHVRMYINTGTYLPLIEKTADGQGFSTAHQMTGTFFYCSDEDTEGRDGDGPTMSLWSGVRRKSYVGTV